MAIAIDKPSKYFNTSLWTGNDSTQSLSSFGFSPDLVWIKTRTGTQYHGLFDTIRGALVSLQSNTTTGDQTFSNSLTSFDSDGFTLGSNDNFNWSTKTYVGWSWRGSDSSAVSNTSGSISSTVSANTTSGFSIVSYTGTGANATVGHGLGVAPKMVIVKSRSNATDWIVGNTNIGWTKLLRLNTTDEQQTNNYFNDTAPTSSVFSLGTTVNVNGSGYTYIAYCFAEVKGYSKFSSYVGNGSTDGTYVHLGFTPAFVMTRRTDSAENWAMFDNKRDGFNVNNRIILANTSDAENTTNTYLDLLSNGFKARSTSGAVNSSGGNYIYMAFASSPFTSSKGICATAK
jgi:hypothetical protein